MYIYIVYIHRYAYASIHSNTYFLYFLRFLKYWKFIQTCFMFLHHFLFAVSVCGGAVVWLNDHQGAVAAAILLHYHTFYFYFCTKREAVQTDRRPPKEHASIYSQPLLPLAPCALIGSQWLRPLPPPPKVTMATPTSLSHPIQHHPSWCGSAHFASKMLQLM